MTRVGGLLFAIGALAALVTVGEWLITGSAPGVWAYYLAMLMPLGFALVGVDFFRSIRRSNRRL